jgi:DNA-binding transcriptional regulator YiaG
LIWSQIPADYDDQIRRVRRRLGLTQAQFAARVGAARKAVVYQWESRKRCPSPLFWQIREIGASDSCR